MKLLIKPKTCEFIASVAFGTAWAMNVVTGDSLQAGLSYVGLMWLALSLVLKE